ncbi:MAG: hypothetical protein ACI4IQ_03945 [Eubacterium sp.]
MKETNKCPICPRECDLSAPHCSRGEEYVKTGKIPESSERSHHSGRLQFDNKEQQLVMKYLHHAVGIADSGGITQEMAGEMFSVLTTEETSQLAYLLEKLSDHWMNIAPNKPNHHGGHH